MRLFRQLFWVFTVLGILLGILLLFTYDIIKIEWISFMEIQPSYRQMEDPLPVPERSIPIEGPIAIPGMGPPANPVAADEALLLQVRQVLVHRGERRQVEATADFLQARRVAVLLDEVVQVIQDLALAFGER